MRTMVDYPFQGFCLQYNGGLPVSRLLIAMTTQKERADL